MPNLKFNASDMTKLAKKLMNKLYSQCDDMAAYSHYLTSKQCDDAFRYIRNIVLFVKTGSDDKSDCDNAIEDSIRLNELIVVAKNGYNRQPC